MIAPAQPLKNAVDGHEYTDFVMAFGAFLLGDAEPEVAAAASEELKQGSLLSTNRSQPVLFAAALLQRFAAADMAVLLKTRSEATTAAFRIPHSALRGAPPAAVILRVRGITGGTAGVFRSTAQCLPASTLRF